jgi:hypothetical protein
MAVVRIDDPEGRRQPLPEICAVCGANATTWKAKKFVWQPPWVWILLLAGVLPFAIVAIILTKRMRVRIPFCDEHRNHWRWRTHVIFGGFFAVVGLCILYIVTLATVGEGHKSGALFGLVCGGSLLGLSVWVVVAIVVSVTAVRPAEITDYTITLKGVSQEFAEAVREEHRRRSPPDVEAETERYWRERRDSRPREDYERERDYDRERRRTPDERIEPE